MASALFQDEALVCNVERGMSLLRKEPQNNGVNIGAIAGILLAVNNSNRCKKNRPPHDYATGDQVTLDSPGKKLPNIWPYHDKILHHNCNDSLEWNCDNPKGALYGGYSQYSTISTPILFKRI